MADLDLNQVYDLVREAKEIDNAMLNLNGGGRIISMRIGTPPPLPQPEDPEAPPPPQPPLMPATVNTVDIEYPPSMTEAIKAALQARRDQLAQQLVEHGLGGR